MDITDILRKHFGDDAQIEEMYWGGLRITSEYGQIEYKDDRFENPVGGRELYEAMVLCSEEIWGGLAVKGPPKHITASMAWGEVLGVNVIPEVWDESQGRLTFLSCIPVFGICAWIAHLLFPGWQAFAAALIVTICIGYGLILPAFTKSGRRDARRRGQDYRDVFPNMHGSDRKAKEEEARRRGHLG